MDYVLNQIGYFGDSGRFLVESSNHKDSILRLSTDEYSELKEMGIYTKTQEITSIIGNTLCEANIYFPEKTDPEFKQDNNGFYIVPMDNIGKVELTDDPDDEEAEDELFF